MQNKNKSAVQNENKTAVQNENKSAVQNNEDYMCVVVIVLSYGTRGRLGFGDTLPDLSDFDQEIPG